MEPIGAFLDEESWASLSRMFSTDQDSFLNHTNDIFSIEIPQDFVFNEENVAAFHNENSMCSSDTNLISSSPNLDSVSQETGNLVFRPNESNGDNLVHVINRDFEPSNVIFPVFGDDLMEEILMCVKEERGTNQLACNAQSQPSANDHSMQLMSKSNTPETQTGAQEDNSFQHPKKRPRRSSNDATRTKSNEEPKMKKNKKAIHKRNDEEETYNARQLGNGQSSTSCSIEDCSNATQESNEENSESQSQGLATASSNRKTRAGRGSATDPQSLYARRRREKINERLRILQSLVPNGTKVDISTMLEEAVQYVKFLQLQIKLLSSDELWMYAPIAYNGMDIDLHHKFSPSLI